MVARLTRALWRLILVFTILGAAAGVSAASDWFTRVWQTDDGLPNNRVTAISQGSDGYLWIGTALGLDRFDGIRFTRFSYLDSLPASSRSGAASSPIPSETALDATGLDEGVNFLAPSQSGGLWILTRRGLVVLVGPNYSQVTEAGRGLPNARAVTMCEDRNGCLWIAYPDSIWRVRNEQAERVTGLAQMRTGGFPGGFVQDSDGTLWFAKGNGVYLLRLLSKGTEADPANPVRFELVTTTIYKAHLAASHGKGIWVATGKQLFKCDSEGHIRDYGSYSPADIHAGTTAVLEDHTGAFWIGTSSGGLFRHTDAGFEQVDTSHPDILSLAEDREGNIWVGTAGGGLDRVSTRHVQLEGLESGTRLVGIQSICEDTNGVLWGATQNGLLVARLNGGWAQALSDSPLTNAVDCVAADREGRVWIGTRNSGLFCWQNGRFSNWDTNKGLVGHVLAVLLPSSSGDLWIAEQAPTSLQRLRNGQITSFRVPAAVGHLTALAEDKEGIVWVGTEMGKLLQVENDSLDTQASPIGEVERSILCLYTTSDGALWIGYEGAGLGRLKGGRFARIGRIQGLYDDYVSQIVGEDAGWLWFGGERGIFKVRRDDLEAVLNGRAEQVSSVAYGRNEGLFSTEASSVSVSPNVAPGGFRGRDGRLWVPMRKGLAVVDTSNLGPAPLPPAALLTQVTVDGQTVASRGGSGVTNLISTETVLRLPPTHHHLVFDFTAIHLSAPESIHFRYQLLGFDSGWIDAEGSRSAEYSRLTAADYQFRVQTCIGGGPWSKSAATLNLSVAPFFWQTWTFRAGAVVLFTSLVVAVVGYVLVRRYQARLRMAEQQAALDKERSRIARDLHDDLGCSLNQVALTLDMTHREAAAGEQLNGKIERCSSMVRQAAKSVDEIVWAINPRNDTLRYMVDYISQFGVEFLHSADIRCRVDLPEQLPERHMPPEVRHSLFLAVKEALNNIARHAKASEVRLRVTDSAQQVVIEVEDNGCGFDHSPDNGSADGLRNMKQRMEEIGGRFELRSRSGAGTRVSLQYNWPKNGEGAT